MEGLSKHDHVVLETDAPARILFNDHRRFGLMDLLETKTLETDKLFKDIGIEPLSPGFNAGHLAAALDGKKTPIKPPCSTKGWWRGWAISMSPRPCSAAASRPSGWRGSLKADEIKKLVPAIKKVLQDAIKAGGSSLRDHARPDGELGAFQHHFLVYDREELALQAWLSRQGQADRAGWALHLLLSQMPEMRPAMSVVLTEIKGAVGIATLNRPEALNALNTPLLDALAGHAGSLGRRSIRRVMIVTGSAKAFAAGADIKEMAPKSFAEMHREKYLRPPVRPHRPGPQTGHRRRRRLRLGGGCELALALDS